MGIKEQLLKLNKNNIIYILALLVNLVRLRLLRACLRSAQGLLRLRKQLG
jgi:hypothetical protein